MPSPRSRTPGAGFSRIVLLLPVLAIALAADSAMADPHPRGYNSRFTVSSHGFRPDFRHNVSRGNRFNTGYGWNRHYRNDFYYGSGYRYRPYRNDGWSVSLNLGSAWAGTGAWYGLTGYPYAPYRNRTSVIYAQPTVVYVNDSSRVAGRVSGRASERVVERSSPRPARSLLRDIHGDCWERTYDSRGVESRMQLPDSACNF